MGAGYKAVRTVHEIVSRHPDGTVKDHVKKQQEYVYVEPSQPAVSFI